MCRIKNIARNGIQVKTQHIPKAEKRKEGGNHQRTKRFSQILRKTKDITKALEQCCVQDLSIKKGGAT